MKWYIGKRNTNKFYKKKMNKYYNKETRMNLKQRNNAII